MALQVLAFATLVTAVCSLWRNNLLLSLFVLVEGEIALAFWQDARDISFLVVIGGMGALAEAVFVGSGAWHYANPSFFGVPLWFPIAFGTPGSSGGVSPARWLGCGKRCFDGKHSLSFLTRPRSRHWTRCRRTRLEGAASAPRGTALESVAPQR